MIGTGCVAATATATSTVTDWAAVPALVNMTEIVNAKFPENVVETEESTPRCLRGAPMNDSTIAVPVEVRLLTAGIPPVVDTNQSTATRGTHTREAVISTPLDLQTDAAAQHLTDQFRQACRRRSVVVQCLVATDRGPTLDTTALQLPRQTLPAVLILAARVRGVLSLAATVMAAMVGLPQATSIASEAGTETAQEPRPDKVVVMSMAVSLVPHAEDDDRIRPHLGAH